MHRRTFLTVTGASFLAGCSGGSDGSDESESEFRGPTDEDRTYVDLQYREYTEEERSTVRENAESIAYDELHRNVEEYVGEAVKYDGIVAQNIEYESHLVFFIAINNNTRTPVYASWTGDRFIKGDAVRIWAEVMGIEVFQTGAGSERSVPALSIADIELLE